MYTLSHNSRQIAWRCELAPRQFQFMEDCAVILNQPECDFRIRQCGIDCKLAKGIFAGDAVELSVPLGFGHWRPCSAAQASSLEFVEIEARGPGNAEAACAMPIARNQQDAPDPVLLDEFENPLATGRADPPGGSAW